MMISTRSAAILVSLAGFTPAQTLLVPAAAAAELSSSSGVPFATRAADRVQFVLDAGHWAGVTTPIRIQQLRFRADGAAGSWPGTTIGSLQVDLCHAALDHTLAGPDPQQNLGEDVVRAFDGPAAIDPGTSAGGGAVGPFYVTLSLTSPFVYYPAWGRDLVVDLTSSGAVTSGGYRLDAATSVSLGSSRVHAGQVRPTAVATEFSFAPHSGAFAAFDVSAASGPGPLTVQFTDRSWTDDPGGITAWAWDFDNDGTVDSTSPNPSFTYTGCGMFSPSLTVTDAGSTATRVRTDLVVLDSVHADFVVDVRESTSSPHLVQFTDLSSGSPSQWAWDFDGDGQTDSTLQNPIASFPTGVYDVTLTASSACSSDATTIVGAVVVGPQVRTPFAGNNGIDPPGGVFFDVDVTASTGLQVSALDLHIRDDAGFAFQVEVYLTSSTHVGKDGDGTVWRRVATGNAVSRGLTLPTFCDVSDFFLPQGRYGLAIYLPNARHRYTQVGVGSPVTYGNGDLTLSLGAARADRFSGARFDHRVWNGAIHYRTTTMGGVYGPVGEGCANAGGHVATLTRVPGTELRLGQQFGARVGNLQPTQAALLLILGYNNRFAAPGVPLPLGLGPFGLPGCTLRVEALDTFLLVNSGGTADWVVTVPNQGALQGLPLFNQALVLDSAAGNGIGAVLSDAAAGIVGG